MNILVLAPHADDEVLGCGGVMAKHQADGDSVYVAIMTDASVGAPEMYTSQQIDIVREEALKAHTVLGVKETVFFDFPAPRLETFPQYKIASQLAELIERIKPQVVYVPHRDDLHLDHGAIYNAALVACRPAAAQSVRDIYAYETLSETELGHPRADSMFIPTHFVDVSEYIDKKYAGLNSFASQMRPFPSSRSIEAVEALAKLRGATVFVNRAEAFMTVRSIRK